MASKKIYHHTTNFKGVTHSFLKGKSSRMTKDDVALLRRNFRIPHNYQSRLPLRGKNSTVDFQERWMSVHEASFHLPLHNFGLKFLRCNGLALGQLHPNGCAQLAGFFVLCHETSVTASVDFLFCFFYLCLL